MGTDEMAPIPSVFRNELGMNTDLTTSVWGHRQQDPEFDRLARVRVDTQHRPGHAQADRERRVHLLEGQQRPGRTATTTAR